MLSTQEATAELNMLDTVAMATLCSFDDPELQDDGDLVVELIDLYLQETARLISLIDDAIGREDWVTVRRTAHNLRGSSSNLGILKTAQICERLEHDHSPDSTAAQFLQLLKNEFKAVRPILETERARRVA